MAGFGGFGAAPSAGGGFGNPSSGFGGFGSLGGGNKPATNAAPQTTGFGGFGATATPSGFGAAPAVAAPGGFGSFGQAARAPVNLFFMYFFLFCAV